MGLRTMRFTASGRLWAQQSGSSKSTRPSPSSSMQLPQISCFGCSGPQPGTAVWSQAPPVQPSVVQALPSSQSAAASQRWQSGMTESWQLPSGPQASVVQEFWSLQSAAVVQGTQPAWGWCSQTPLAAQMSVVQAVDRQSVAEGERGGQAGRGGWWENAALGRPLVGSTRLLTRAVC